MPGPNIEDMYNLFLPRENQGEDKVTSLSNAIKAHLQPGMTIQINREASAAIFEIVRQFVGQKPKFTLVMSVFTGMALTLLHCGLLKKLITSNCCHVYPTMGSVPLVCNALRDRKLEIESWSLCSLQQRLMAASFGLGFMPTNVVLGSSIAEENQQSFALLEDPFVNGQKTGVVKALHPDISIIHARVADRYGNAIPNPPYEENVWGPKASKNGVILTVDKLVSTEYIREHNDLVKIPGYLVKSVAVTPFGGHPNGITGNGMSGFYGYGEDYQFMFDFRNAIDSSLFDTWIKEWILDCSSHTNFLRKLGRQRLIALRLRSSKDAWKHEITRLQQDKIVTNTFTSLEMMVIAAAKEIQKRVLKNGHRTILAGGGTSSLAAWIAYYLTDTQNYGLDLLIGSGGLGYMPRPCDPTVTNIANLTTCKMQTDTIDMYSTIVGGTSSKCLSVLSAAQVDKWGNGNSTRTTENTYLIGSGGANDASNAREVFLVVAQRKERFVDQLPYVTFTGKNVRAMITTEAVLEKSGPEDEFILTGILPSPEPLPENERLQRIKACFGWDLKIAPYLRKIAPPDREDLLIARTLDPDRIFIGRLG